MPYSRTMRFLAFALAVFTLAAGPLTAQQNVRPLRNLPGVTARSLAFAIPSGDFSLKLNPTVFSATTRQSGVATVTVSPLNGFNEAVSFSCSELPAGAACSFTPATVTPSSAPATTTLTVAYSKPVALLRRTSSPLLPESALACAVLFLGWKKRRPLLLCLVAVGFLSLCTGCGTDNQSLQTYTVTLAASSSSAHHSTTFLLTVE